MKVLFVHSIYKPYYRGGAETVAINLVEGLKADGHEVSVVSLGYQDKIEEIDGVKVYRIKPFNVFNYLDINKKPLSLRFLFHLLDIFNNVGPWKIFKISQQEKPDLIFLQGIKGFGYSLPQILSQAGFSVVLRIFDMQYIHPSGLLPKKTVGWPIRAHMFLVKWLLGRVPLVIFPSDYIKDIYLKLGFFQSSKVAVVVNPLSADNFAPLKIKPEKTRKVFLYLGQVEKYKGVGDLIEACSGLEGDFSLLIAGEGNDLNHYKRLVISDDRIIFHGRLDRQELNKKIWPQVDLLINPSRVEESFGMVVAEAYAHGVPVIASDIGALKELVKEGETGWLFRPGDVAQLRYKLQQIVDGKLELEPLAENCLQEANKFSVGGYLEKLYELIGYKK